MKFFKAEQPMSWEDETAAVRLLAIAARTRTSISPDADEGVSGSRKEQRPETPDIPQ